MFSQIVRHFGTTHPVHKLVQPPVQVFGIEGRYATALYSAAMKQKSLDAVEKDLNTIRETLKKDVALLDFCVNPSLQRSTKTAAFSKVLDKLKVNASTKNMFATLAENGRLARINVVLDKFTTIMSAHRGEVECTVRTAKPLDKSTEQELRAALNEFLKSGEKLHLTLETDPSLIGGMVVTIGDRFIDLSIARKVRMFTEVMERPV